MQWHNVSCGEAWLQGPNIGVVATTQWISGAAITGSAESAILRRRGFPKDRYGSQFRHNSSIRFQAAIQPARCRRHTPTSGRLS